MTFQGNGSAYLILIFIFDQSIHRMEHQCAGLNGLPLVVNVLQKGDNEIY